MALLEVNDVQVLKGYGCPSDGGNTQDEDEDGSELGSCRDHADY